jgi:hypothetical protein
LDSKGEVNGYQYIGKDGKVEKSFKLERGEDGSINKMIDGNGTVYEKDDKATNVFGPGDAWKSHNPNDRSITRTPEPFGTVDVDKDFGLYNADARTPRQQAEFQSKIGLSGVYRDIELDKISEK